MTRAFLVAAVLASLALGPARPPAAATAPLVSLTIAGPPVAILDEPATFSGRLTALAAGLPLQEIAILVDGHPTATAVTEADGSWATTLTFDALGRRVVQATFLAGGGARSEPIEVTVGGRPLGTRSQDLIAAALADGTIDYPTSLVYRAYALFGDPRLPAEFIGTGPKYDEHSLFGLVQRDWQTLPAEAQAALHPYIVRPTNLQSAFIVEAQEVGLRSSGVSMSAAAAGASQQAPAPTPCQKGYWRSDGARHVRVWACARPAGEAPDEAGAAAEIERVIRIAEPLWEAAAQLLPKPLADAGLNDPQRDAGPDDLVDIYMLSNWTEPAPRDGGEPLGGSGGAAVPDEPFGNGTSSGYIILPRGQGPQSTALKVAHELFHLQQFRQNQKVTLEGAGDWFAEASATWAQTYLGRTLSALPEQVLARFTKQFQPYPEVSLLSSDSEHHYASFIWALFMEQQLGKDAVADVWLDLAGKGPDPSQVVPAIQGRMPFTTHFRDFAVRNLNLTLHGPGSPYPPARGQPNKRYMDLVAGFPDGAPAMLTDRMDVAGRGDDPFVHDISRPMPGLSAQYHHLRFTDPRVRGVELTFAPSRTLDVDVVIRAADGWKRIKLDPNVATWVCRDNDIEKDATEMYVILSNHAVADSITGRLRARTARASRDVLGERVYPCGGSLVGTVTTTRIQHGDFGGSWRESATIDVDFGPPGPLDPGSSSAEAELGAAVVDRGSTYRFEGGFDYESCDPGPGIQRWAGSGDFRSPDGRRDSTLQILHWEHPGQIKLGAFLRGRYLNCPPPPNRNNFDYTAEVDADGWSSSESDVRVYDFSYAYREQPGNGSWWEYDHSGSLLFTRLGMPEPEA